VLAIFQRKHLETRFSGNNCLDADCLSYRLKRLSVVPDSTLTTPSLSMSVFFSDGLEVASAVEGIIFGNFFSDGLEATSAVEGMYIGNLTKGEPFSGVELLYFSVFGDILCFIRFYLQRWNVETSAEKSAKTLLFCWGFFMPGILLRH
jgi:hypothetical protein